MEEGERVQALRDGDWDSPCVACGLSGGTGWHDRCIYAAPRVWDRPSRAGVLPPSRDRLNINRLRSRRRHA